MNDSTAPGHTLFYVRDDVGQFYGTFSNYNLYDDNWVHLTWVISNITNQSSLLYIDGTETSWTGTVNGSSSNKLEKYFLKIGAKTFISVRVITVEVLKVMQI